MKIFKDQNEGLTFGQYNQAQQQAGSNQIGKTGVNMKGHERETLQQKQLFEKIHSFNGKDDSIVHNESDFIRGLVNQKQERVHSFEGVNEMEQNESDINLNNHLNGLSIRDNEEEEMYQEGDFRIEIERRFKQSQCNQKFSFPLVEKKYNEEEDDEDDSNSQDSSMSSVDGVSVYNLHAQNMKNYQREYMKMQDEVEESMTKFKEQEFLRLQKEEEEIVLKRNQQQQHHLLLQHKAIQQQIQSQYHQTQIEKNQLQLKQISQQGHQQTLSDKRKIVSEQEAANHIKIISTKAHSQQQQLQNRYFPTNVQQSSKIMDKQKDMKMSTQKSLMKNKQQHFQKMNASLVNGQARRMKTEGENVKTHIQSENSQNHHHNMHTQQAEARHKDDEQDTIYNFEEALQDGSDSESGEIARLDDIVLHNHQNEKNEFVSIGSQDNKYNGFQGNNSDFLTNHIGLSGSNKNNNGGNQKNIIDMHRPHNESSSPMKKIGGVSKSFHQDGSNIKEIRNFANKGSQQNNLSMNIGNSLGLKKPSQHITTNTVQQQIQQHAVSAAAAATYSNFTLKNLIQQQNSYKFNGNNISSNRNAQVLTEINSSSSTRVRPPSKTSHDIAPSNIPQTQFQLKTLCGITRPNISHSIDVNRSFKNQKRSSSNKVTRMTPTTQSIPCSKPKNVSNSFNCQKGSTMEEDINLRGNSQSKENSNILLSTSKSQIRNPINSLLASSLHGGFAMKQRVGQSLHLKNQSNTSSSFQTTQQIASLNNKSAIVSNFSLNSSSKRQMLTSSSSSNIINILQNHNPNNFDSKKKHLNNKSFSNQPANSSQNRLSTQSNNREAISVINYHAPSSRIRTEVAKNDDLDINSLLQTRISTFVKVPSKQGLLNNKSGKNVKQENGLKVSLIEQQVSQHMNHISMNMQSSGSSGKDQKESVNVLINALKQSQNLRNLSKASRQRSDQQDQYDSNNQNGQINQQGDNIREFLVYNHTKSSNSINANLTQVNTNQAHVNQTNANQAHVNQTNANQAHVNQTNAHQTHVNQIHTNQTHVNQAQANQTHVNQAQANQTHVNQAQANQTHANQIIASYAQPNHQILGQTKQMQQNGDIKRDGNSIKSYTQHLFQNYHQTQVNNYQQAISNQINVNQSKQIK